MKPVRATSLSLVAAVRRSPTRAAALLLAVLLCASLTVAVVQRSDGPARANGPVLSADSDGSSDYPDAALPGELTLRRGCLALAGDPVLWPAGTRWEGRSRSVILPDATRLTVGQTVTLGGGLVKPSSVTAYSDTAQGPIMTCMAALGTSNVVLTSGAL